MNFPILLTRCVTAFFFIVILNNPDDTYADAIIEFYNLDGSLAYSEEFQDLSPHSTIILEGEDYKEYWDDDQANAKIMVTDGVGLIGCTSHSEPIYYIGFSTILLPTPTT